MTYFKHKKYFVSTAITYPNSIPHIGSSFEYVLADAFVRFLRMIGKEVFFVTGTDDFGSKNQRKALEEYKKQNLGADINNLTEQEVHKIAGEYIDSMVKKFKEVHKDLNVNYDYFISTATDPHHKKSVQTIWGKIKESGDFYEQDYSGYYCEGCESFKTEKDLAGGRCPEHPNKDLEFMTVNDLFFKVSRYSDQISKLIESGQLLVKPDYYKKIMLDFLKEGVDDTSVTRNKNQLKWGIQVPDEEDRVMYVWIDALTNYITASGYSWDRERFKDVWEDSYKVHIIGKGIERFHLSIWPSMLLSACIPVQNETFIHGFITADGQKMSKSLGNVINPQDITAKYGTDAYRYWSLTRGRLSEDADFTWDKFIAVYNSDLVNGLGNTLNRVMAIRKTDIKFDTASKEFSELLNVKDIADQGHNISQSIEDIINTAHKKAEESFYEFNLKPLKDQVFLAVDKMNEFFNRCKPWEFEEQRREIYAAFLAEKLIEVFYLLYPVIPEASEIALKKLAGKFNMKNNSFYIKLQSFFAGVDESQKKFLFDKK